MQYQTITVHQTGPVVADDRGPYRPSTLRLGRILQTDGSDYRFAESSPWELGALLHHVQHVAEKVNSNLHRPAPATTAFYPPLVVGQGHHLRQIEIIVLVLAPDGFNGKELPSVRLISPDGRVDTGCCKELYQRMKKKMDKESGIIYPLCTSDEEIKSLVFRNRPTLTTPQNKDSVVLFNGYKMVVSCIPSDFLGVHTWAMDFEFVSGNLRSSKRKLNESP